MYLYRYVLPYVNIYLEINTVETKSDFNDTFCTDELTC